MRSETLLELYPFWRHEPKRLLLGRNGKIFTCNYCQRSSLPFSTVLPGIMAFGLLHGINPSHGWPIATLYSMRSKRPFLAGITSSSIIAGAHFVSSIVVVAAYMFLTTLIEIPQLYLRYGAAIGLGILAYMFWREKGEDLQQTQHGHLHNENNYDTALQVSHEHNHWHKDGGHHSHAHIHMKRQSQSLRSITSFAFILGFAHEEEFVILAVAAGGGGDPLTLMIAYAGSVAAAIIGITLISLSVYTRFQQKIIYYTKYLPKVTAILIALMAVGFAIGLI